MKGLQIAAITILATGYGLYRYAKPDAPVVYPQHGLVASVPTIEDLSRATLANDRCFDGTNTPLAKYIEGGLEFYAQQRSSLDPQHPYVVLARVDNDILDAKHALELNYDRLRDKDRQTFCTAAREVAALWPSSKPQDFPKARPMPFLIPSAD